MPLWFAGLCKLGEQDQVFLARIARILRVVENKPIFLARAHKRKRKKKNVWSTTRLSKSKTARRVRALPLIAKRAPSERKEANSSAKLYGNQDSPSYLFNSVTLKHRWQCLFRNLHLHVNRLQKLLNRLSYHG